MAKKRSQIKVFLKQLKLSSLFYGKELANELRKHDIYITGSKNEPSGNHHMEGALCGLPILYVNSGALPEYCQLWFRIYKKQFN